MNYKQSNFLVDGLNNIFTTTTRLLKCVPPYRAIAIIGCFKTYLYPPTQIDLPANA
jgi:hypothetical protein